jgi:hypothetical protein
VRRFPELFGRGLGVIDLPVAYDSWQDAAAGGSRLVADPGPYGQLVPVLRRSAFHDMMHETRGTTRLSPAEERRVRMDVTADPDPALVVRRVGHLAQIQAFDGQPYSAPMPVEEATRALREALRARGGLANVVASDNLGPGSRGSLRGKIADLSGSPAHDQGGQQ